MAIIRKKPGMIFALQGTISTVLIGIKTAFSEMKVHKVRSALSVSGVTMGVASMVVLASLMGGVQAYLDDVMSRWLGSIVFSPRGDASPREKVSWGRSPGLRLSDGAYIKAASPIVDKIYDRILRMGEVRLGEVGAAANVLGVSEATFGSDFEYFSFGRGRALSKEDFEHGKPVCLVARDLMERLRLNGGGNGTWSPGAREGRLEFQGRVFEVVGVFEPFDRGKVANDFKGCVIVPLRTMQKYVTGLDPDPVQLEVAVTDPGNLQADSRVLANLLAAKHRGVEDYLYTLPQGAQKIQDLLENTILLLGLLAFLSLGMGGFGIMNVMLSSINERTFEIGVRMALGAKKSQIFIQFLSESMTLSLLGGLFGSLLGAMPLLFKAEIKESIDGIEPTLIPGHFFLILLVIVGIGTIFGLYPAAKAAKMRPIEALREE